VTVLRLATFAAVVCLVLNPDRVPAQTFTHPPRPEKPVDALAEHEEKAIARLVERQAKSQDSDHGRWLLELNRVYPGRCAAGRGRADFDQWFDLLADGRGEWRKDAAPNRAVGDLFDRVTQRLELGPVPSIRKDEFVQFANAVLRPDKNGAVRLQEQFAEADKMFRILDRDGNGLIDDAEQTARMKAVLAAEPDRPSTYDKDRYRVYFQGRVATAVELVTIPIRAAAANPSPPHPGGEHKKSTPPAKANRRPAGLPPWFDLLDADADGQVSFAEWRTDLLPGELFQVMDLNGDGLLTPTEYLKFVKLVGDKLPIELKISAGHKK
jgi:Ca2+-binding EF-hand superfamily protein